MAGIYIHIPFCKQACYYCDFHFSTSLKNKDDLLKAIKQELVLQKQFFSESGNENTTIESIYFGGGTPSLALDKTELNEILDIIHSNYSVARNIEVTLESNPDDLTHNYLTDIFKAGINRLSIGIQSFDDKDLAFLNRSHNSKQAVNCVKKATGIGFQDISVDLIYGIQSSNRKTWQNNLSIVSELPINHLSCYNLTIEEKTVFGKWVKEQKIKKIDDEDSLNQFHYLVQWADQYKFEHYEISNFCKDGAYSKHNTSYWQNKPYLGVGPSAHSYNLKNRYWNVNNNNAYIKKIFKGSVPNETEILSEENRYNEYVMTGLRTKWGVNLKILQDNYQIKVLEHFLEAVKPFMDQKLISETNGIYTITLDGKLISDKIITSLIIA